MKKLLYISGNAFFIKTDESTGEYSSQKIKQYIKNLKSIKDRDKWKTSGVGARFMGAYQLDDSEEDPVDVRLNGAALCGEEIIYSATLGEMSGVYKKTPESTGDEGHVFSSNNLQVYKLSFSGDNCAVSVGGMFERHIAMLELSTGELRELTEGDVQEDYPSFSKDGRKIYFSCAGLAMSAQGHPVGLGPFGIIKYDINANDMDEIFADEKYDYISPKEDMQGNIYFIRRPYKHENGNLLKDIVLFPFRILAAIFGWLNFFSIIYGGESLRGGKSSKGEKAKAKSEKDLFWEGNIIKAQETERQNKRAGEKHPGIIPRSWELMKADKNGDLSCVKKGVMDYAVCENGDIIYSNGRAVIKICGGDEQLLEKCRLAYNLTEF